MELVMPDLFDPALWISLATLCFLEIVLGIDNVIFISIVAGKTSPSLQRKARNIGLLLAMVFRIMLLLGIKWLIGLNQTVFTLPMISGISETPTPMSYKDIILIGGGLFLIIKCTLEIHHKLMQSNSFEKPANQAVAKGLGAILLQIILVDAVFSFDSILTAIGLTESIFVMIIAVIISMGVMMLFAGAIIKIMNQQPTLQILALTFLIVIGVVLIANGFHQKVSKGIIYSCLSFSLTVELLNIRFRRKEKNLRLNNTD